MYFAPDSPPGQRGGEGCTILAVQLDEMLSFTWNNPPSLPQVRSQFTHVVVRLLSEGLHTIVRLQHDGWGQGGEWEQAINYFDAAWKRVVLPRLSYRFVHGPIDWDNVPDLTQS